MLLLLGTRLPLATALSVWRPATLFGQGLLLILDEAGWGCAIAICGLLLAVVLSRVGETGPDAVDLAWAFSLAAFGLMGALAGNMLTLIIAWSLMGACRLAWWIMAGDRDQRQEGLIHLGGQEMAAPLLLLLAAFLNQTSVGPADLDNPLRSGPGAVMFLLAVVARSAPLGTARALTGQSTWTRPGYAAFQLLPPMAALATLGRVQETAMPAAAAITGQWLGLLTLAVAAFGWAMLVERKLGAGWLAWALSGLGVMMASTAVADGVRAMTVLVMLLGGLLWISQVKQPWQRIWPVLAFLAAVGLPGSPGAGIAQSLGRSLLSGDLRWAWIVVLAGMALIGAGALQHALPSGTYRQGGIGSRVSGTDLAGMALVAASLTVSVRQGWVGSGPGLALMGVTGLAALAVAWMIGRRPRLLRDSSLFLPNIPGIRWAGEAIRTASTAVSHAIGGLAALFEGRAGLLWMFLVLLAAWLAIQA